MCVQCVAQSVPYAAIAIGGLRLASWNSRRGRRSIPPVGASDDNPEPVGRTGELVVTTSPDRRSGVPLPQTSTVSPTDGPG